jgi:hypothetical protein
MTVEEILQKEVIDSQRWIDVEKDQSTYKRDLKKRVELMNWVLQNMENPNINICKIIESKMEDTLIKIRKTDSIFEMDPLDSELRNLNWILYQVRSNDHNILC